MAVIDAGQTSGGSSNRSSVTAYGRRLTQGVIARAVTQPNQPVVFMGNRSTEPLGGAAGRMTASRTQPGPVLRSVNDLLLEFEAMTVKEKKGVAMKMAKAGFFGRPNEGESLKQMVNDLTLNQVEGAYGQFLTDAAARYQNGQQITPDDLFELHREYNARTLGGGAAGSQDSGSPYANATITRTDTTKSIDVFSAPDARGLTRAMLRRELDRDPTEEEFEDFVAALQTYTENHPTTTTSRTTTKYDEFGSPMDTDTTTTSRGGITSAGVEELLTRRAQAQPGWAEWQAVGTYFPALMQMLGAGVPGV